MTDQQTILKQHAAKILQELQSASGGQLVSNDRCVELLVREMAELKEPAEKLAEAIAKAAIEVGILRPDIEALSGPQLLLLLDDLAESAKSSRPTASGDDLVEIASAAAFEKANGIPWASAADAAKVIYKDMQRAALAAVGLVSPPDAAQEVANPSIVAGA